MHGLLARGLTALAIAIFLAVFGFTIIMFKLVAVPSGPSDDALKEQLEQRSREAYFKQLNEAQAGKKH